jgi:hypothetical protein
MVRIENSFRPVHPQELQEFEDRTGIVLPDSYKEFLLKTNGGQPEPREFYIPECGTSALIGTFYGIDERGKPLDVETELAGLREQLPTGVVPIGEDPGGNRLLIGTSAKHQGQVYYWDSANRFECTSEKKNTYLVAKSMTELLESLK